MRGVLACSFGMGLLVTAFAASAHIKLIAPAPRFPDGPPNGDQKTGPCGGGTPTGAITEFAPGETITVIWAETVNHPGHFRISFDPDGGDDGLVDPTGYDDFYTAPTVLLDDIEDMGGSNFSEDITLPTTECEKCTLQLIQVMTDKPPWGPGGGNDIYYQCADIRIKAGGGTGGAGSGGSGSGPSTGAGGEGTGSGSGPSGAGGGATSGGSGNPTEPPSSAGAESDGGCSTSGAGTSSGGTFALALLAAFGLARARRRR